MRVGKKNSSILGIDVQTSEVRVVKVDTSGSRPQLVQAGTAAIPAGMVQEGLVSDAAGVAAIIRNLLKSIDSEDASKAVFGVPLERTVFRNFTIPPVPEDEVPLLVAGEVEHYCLVSAEGGSYSYLKLSAPARDAGLGAMIAAVVGVEAAVTSSFRRLAGEARLEISALEPTSLGMYRASLRYETPGSLMVALMLSQDGSEISFSWDSKLIAYRRLDKGSRSLLGSDLGALYVEGVDRLAVEIRRTLDYFKREYPDYPPVDSLSLVLNSSSLLPLCRHFETRLGLTVTPVAPPQPPDLNLNVEGQTRAEAENYSAAYGLAMHFTGADQSVKIDLYESERTASARKLETRNLAGSLVVSAVTLVFSIAIWWLFSAQVRAVNASTASSRRTASIMKAHVSEVQSARDKRKSLYMALCKEGIPLDSIMDDLAGSTGSRVGIDTLTIGNSLDVEVSAQTLDEAEMLRMVQLLQKSPVLDKVSIVSFQRASSGDGTTFQVSGHTVSLDRLRQGGVN